MAKACRRGLLSYRGLKIHADVRVAEGAKAQTGAKGAGEGGIIWPLTSIRNGIAAGGGGGAHDGVEGDSSGRETSNGVELWEGGEECFFVFTAAIRSVPNFKQQRTRNEVTGKENILRCGLTKFMVIHTAGVDE